MTLPDPTHTLPLVSVIIPTHAGASNLEASVYHLLRNDYPNFEVIVVDNGATPETREVIARLPGKVRVVRSEENLGFPGGCNLGVAQAEGEIIALLNDDAEARPDWLRELVGALTQSPDVGLVGSLVLEPDGEHIQSAGCRFYSNYLNIHLDKGQSWFEAPGEPVERDSVMGAAVAIRRDLLEALGGLAECYFPGYYEDCELCYRLRRLGYRILLVPSARVVHYEKQTIREDEDYFRVYHRNRWQFILRNLPPGEIVEVCAAEIGWAVNITRWRDFRHHNALLYAYAWGFVRLPAILSARRSLQRWDQQLEESAQEEPGENA